jgi:SAM-dependent methyltransferase
MSEHLGLERLMVAGDPAATDLMNAHYQRQGAMAIGARRDYYDQTDDLFSQETILDINAEIIDVADNCGITRRDNWLDVGSGKVALLEELVAHFGLPAVTEPLQPDQNLDVISRVKAYLDSLDNTAINFRPSPSDGIWAALEPNAAQFGPILYYQPRDPDTIRHVGKLNLEDYAPVWTQGARIHESVAPFQGKAQDMPFPDSVFKVVSAVQSLQSVNPTEQAQVLDEIQRVMRQDGIYEEATTAKRNKEKVRNLEARVPTVLQAIFDANFDTDVVFKEPKPINEWRTSEVAAASLLERFEFVFSYTKTIEVILNKPTYTRERKLNALKRMFYTSRDLYTTSDGYVAQKDIFETAVDFIVDEEVVASDISGRQFRDITSRTVFVASNAPLYLDQMQQTKDKYTRSRTMDDFLKTLHYPYEAASL